MFFANDCMIRFCLNSDRLEFILMLVRVRIRVRVSKRKLYQKSYYKMLLKIDIKKVIS